VLTYALAVLAACANAVSSVLQRKANQRVPQRENMSLRQIRRLLRQPVWFGGILAITAGFLLQASALGTGQLSVVEPVLVLELPFTLMLASWLFRQRLGLREWLPIVAMTAGLAGLLYLLAPSAGGPPRLPCTGGWPALAGTSCSSGAWSCSPATAPSGTPVRTAPASGAARSARLCSRRRRGRRSG
jgi:drug/metabolite transporter (DMT)-like permease